VASIMGMVGLWHVIATTFFKPQYFPGPLVVLATAREMVAPAGSSSHTWASVCSASSPAS
jgi:ABC-type nitrate/sulfonate/bicarbonate transport system permease component